MPLRPDPRPPRAPPSADHEENPVYRAVVEEGLTVGGASVKLPAPTFRDGQSADDQRAALREMAGSTRGGRGDAPALDLGPASAQAARRQGRGGDAPVGRPLLRPPRRRPRRDPPRGGVPQGPARPGTRRPTCGSRPASSRPTSSRGPRARRTDEWFTHATGRLLDRIAVESTDRVVASRSADSLVFAARTDPRFGPDAKFPNRWSTIEPKATGDAFGPPQPFAGGSATSR